MHSVIEVCKFLLQEGMEYVLTERFCQDIVEEYFGCQRKLADEMTILTFAHLATMTTQFASNGQYLVRVEILEEEKTSASHGQKLQMMHYHPERKKKKKTEESRPLCHPM